MQNIPLLFAAMLLATSTTPFVPITSASSTPSISSSTLPGTYPFSSTPPEPVQLLVSPIPDISNLAASSTATSTTISFATGQFSSAEIDYGTSTSYATSVQGPLALDHAVLLAGLAPNTTYHYQIKTTNGNGTESSGDQTFTTPLIYGASSGGPALSELTVIPTYDMATVSWASSAPASGEVFYGTTPNYSNWAISGNAALSNVPSTTHIITLSNLSPSTTYHFMITSTDQTGATSDTIDQTFTTSAF